MINWIEENGEGLLTLIYIVGIPVSFGMLVFKWLGLAVLLSVIWPATGLAYLGYWIVS